MANIRDVLAKITTETGFLSWLQTSHNTDGSLRLRESVLAAGEGIKAQNFSRSQAANTQLLTTNGTNGTVYAMLVPVLAGDVINNIYFGASALATGMVLGKVGVYDTSGNRLAASADQGTAWQTGTGTAGIQKTALTSPVTVTADGVVYIVILCVAGNGTGIMIYRQTSQGTVNNAINSGARPYAAVATQTDLGASLTFSGASAVAGWVGWD